MYGRLLLVVTFILFCRNFYVDIPLINAWISLFRARNTVGPETPVTKHSRGTSSQFVTLFTQEGSVRGGHTPKTH